MRSVVFAEFMHETNSFSLRRTGEREFQCGHLYRGEAAVDAFRGTLSATGAAIDAAADHGWALSVPVVAEATPSGLVSQAFFEQACGWIEQSLRHTPPDGVLLHLHGSMATEHSNDGDGELLQRVRAAVGPQVPVVVVLDLHATVTPAMAQAVQCLLAYRTYPHVDMHERTHQAAALLAQAMAGHIRPMVSLARPPLLYGCDGGRTTHAASPMNRLLAQARTIEASGDALVVSVQAGFSSIDSPHIGPSVAVTTDSDPETGQRLALAFSRLIWNTRHESSIQLTAVPEAVALALASQGETGGPLVMADHADNPGAGGYGDATAVLQAMLEAGLANAIFYAIHDPEAVQAAWQAGTGAELTLDIGGKTAPHMGGGPLRLTGTVDALSDGCYTAHGPMGGGVQRHDGPTVVFQVQGVSVVLTSSNQQANDLAQLTSLGLQPSAASTIALKSMQHFKAAFQPIARRIVEVDSGALCTRNYLARPYRQVRRPIHPLDPVSHHDEVPSHE